MKQPTLHNVWKLDAFMFLSGFHLFSAALVTILTDWGGLTITQVMILQSLFTISIFALEVPTGVVADIWGRKKSLLLGSAISVIGYIVYALYPNFWLFALGEIILGLAFTLRSGAVEAMLYDSVPESQAKAALSRNGGLVLLGLAVGPAIGSLLLNWVEQQQLMMLTAVPFAITFILAALLTEPTVQKHEDSSGTFWQTLIEGVRFFIQHPTLRSLALDMAIIHAVSKMMVWLYQPLLQEFGVSLTWFGVIFAVAVGIEVLAMQAYSRFSEKGAAASRILFWSGLLPAIGLILAGIASWSWLALLGIWLTVGLGMSRKPFFSGLFNEHISSRQRATVLSAIAMSGQLILIPLNPTVGYFADISVQNTLLGLGMLMAVFVIGKAVHQRRIDSRG